ncbi:glycoside hydrolase family 20 protein [Ekhidna sp.]
MRIKIFVVSILLLFSLISCDSNIEKVSISIIPKPKFLKQGSGKFLINERTQLSFGSETKLNSDLFKDYLNSITGFNLGLSDESDRNTIVFMLDDRPGEEYEIRSSPDRVEVKGGSNQAILYAFQSLRQVLLLGDGKTIPSVHIIDQSKFEWRGLLLDCSRHFMERDFVKRYIDLLALYKMNVLHWHLTEDQGWRIEIDKYPKLTEIGAWRDDGEGGRYGGFYSKEDIREIVAYATERGVTVVPEIELPGHSQAALAAYPQLSCTGGPFEVETEWGVFKEIYCAGNDSTFIFLEDVLSEVIELFPSEYIHIGGDEVPKFRWEHCHKCQRRMEIEGLTDEHELQSYFITRIGNFLESKNRRMIGWDEILEGGLPQGAIVQSWRGFDGAIEAVKSGNEAILSPTSHAYFDYGLNDIDLEKVYSFNPIPESISQEAEQLILGGECNMWSEQAPQSKIDSKVFPRLLAMAEVLWNNPADRDFEMFKGRVRGNYKVLDELGVNYGFETVPVKVFTKNEDGRLMVNLEAYDSSIQVFYTSKGERALYERPVHQSMESVWKITFKSGKSTFSDTIFQRFKPHFANGIEPTIASDYNENYAAGGDTGLTNGLKGSNQFRDGNWQGYWGDDVEVMIDLGEDRLVSELSSGFLQYNNAWIFFPTEVSYLKSDDGVTFEKLGTVLNQHSIKEKEQQTQEFVLKLEEPLNTRYIKLKAQNIGICPAWHDAAGSKAWLFIDEFSVK